MMINVRAASLFRRSITSLCKLGLGSEVLIVPLKVRIRQALRIKAIALSVGLAPAFTSGILRAAAPSFKMSDIAKVTEECDKLYLEKKMDEAYNILLPYKDSKNVEILWRLARMTYKRKEFNGSAEEKNSAIDEGLEIIKAANEVDANNANVHKWWAILVGSRENHPSFKSKIEDAFVIREHLNRALELNPDDGYTHYVLGKWCYEVAIVPWYQRKTASVLFATPPTATLEESLQHFQDAEKLYKEVFSRNDLMMAKCLLEMGRKSEAESYLRKCRDNKSTDVDAQNAAKEAQKLMDKYGFK